MPVRVRKLIEDFLSDITIVIPETSEQCMFVRLLLEQDEDVCIRNITSHLGTYDERIVARDDNMITSDIPILPGLHIGQYWSELSASSKDTVWKYLNLLLLAGAKHVRAMDRKNPRTTSSDTKSDISGDLASEIANRLRDPAVRDQMMSTIRETMESIPESDLSGNAIESLEGFLEQLEGTQMSKIFKEISSDLSGEINLKELGIPNEDTLKSMNPQDLIGLISKPEIMKKIMSLVTKTQGLLQSKLESGEIDKDTLAKEGMDLMSKSEGLLKAFSPQAAQMLSSMGGPKMSARDIARNMSKVQASMSKGRSREANTRERLKRKLAERKKKQSQG